MEKALLALISILLIGCGDVDRSIDLENCNNLNTTIKHQDIPTLTIEKPVAPTRIISLSDGQLYDTKLNCSCNKKLIKLVDGTGKWVCFPVDDIWWDGLFINMDCKNLSLSKTDLGDILESKHTGEEFYNGEHCGSVHRIYPTGLEPCYTFGPVIPQAISNSPCSTAILFTAPRLTNVSQLESTDLGAL